MVDVINRRCDHQAHTWQSKHERPLAKARFDGVHLCSNCLLHALGASGKTLCRAIRREHIALGHLVTQQLPLALGLSPEAVLPYYHDSSVHSCQSIARPDLYFVLPRFLIVIEFDENNHSDRSEYSEERHLEVIRRWAKESHGLEHLYALRINERGLFKKTITGSHTGVGRQPREFVWVPTNKFIPSIEKAAQRLVPWFRSALDPSHPLPVGFDPVYGVFIDRV